MGNIGLDTQVSEVGDPAAEGERRFTAMVYSDWEIWGPEGGYVAAIVLRAAGAASPFERPASFFCHYLSVAAFEPVELLVIPLRSGRTVLAQRVEMTQHGRRILDAMVWSVGQVEGLVHSDLRPPEVADPDALKSWPELMPDGDGPPFRFWDNFDQRPIDYVLDWPPAEPLEPTWRAWLRAAPSSAPAIIDDPWVDAARSLIVLDVMSWPAGHRPHAHVEHGFIAPSLDLYASFQHMALGEEWLLLDGHSPMANDGLLSWNGRVWTRDFRLVASGGGQALFRRT